MRQNVVYVEVDVAHQRILNVNALSVKFPSVSTQRRKSGKLLVMLQLFFAENCQNGLTVVFKKGRLFLPVILLKVLYV